VSENVMTGVPLVLEPGKTYVLESDYALTQAQADIIRARLRKFAPNCEFVLLGPGMRIARESQ
jgi:hypothetical protein